MSGTFPNDPAPSAINIDSRTYSHSSESSTGQTLVRSLPGHRWELDFRYQQLTNAEFMPVWAFMASQHGNSGTFKVKIPAHSRTTGSATGATTVNGAHAIGAKDIAVEGLTGTLKAGDLLSFSGDNKVYMLTADRSGPGALHIFPGLHKPLAAGKRVNYTTVAMTVRVKGTKNQFKHPKFDTYTFGVKLIEAT